MPATAPLNARIAGLLTLPPLLWAGNALVGRYMAGQVPPLQLNLWRWLVALALLLPLGWRVLATPARRAEIARRWRELALLGALGVGAYNALQYVALTTSTPINVTLIAASMPLWMMLVGIAFYREHPRPLQWLGAAFSAAGVLVVLMRGDPAQLRALRLVPGDLWMLLAAASWALYSWQLARPPASLRGAARPAWNWGEFMLVQVLFGLGWAATGAAAEWLLTAWGPPSGAAAVSAGSSGQAAGPLSPAVLAAVLLYLGLGPSLLAYRCWGLGVAAVGPALAAFFANLTPLITALASAAWLGEPPHPYHALAFVLIVAGIVVSSRR